MTRRSALTGDSVAVCLIEIFEPLRIVGSGFETIQSHESRMESQSQTFAIHRNTTSDKEGGSMARNYLRTGTAHHRAREQSGIHGYRCTWSPASIGH
jgi:hypothetical protein